ncbi:ABC transporter ATP-binding protein [Paenibacillus melissococcoides]|uniref:ABC transporter ATP-binding protein n=1 Tax=Paenibacillus melissococcoides TaxID=2912268 RepID=A0ABN8U205_9BACL|nr:MULTISPECIES: ABC transporter ATP-binding protein [Paenibacillus]MEB9896539.1 ABC transporter ATP-binding protein [Bacillus cereus]CAH8244762.1 ABC transporter ATP-binding protein [Paenibacillus melissococcoides]CAH8708898.1 ABC transporter ATP-binding protein [Paenibacillus melissococcoides]CAH8709651.1 ABC transporter ATP-binding protein [Paenibacillus melissococcoides]GIO78225.1 ABC transporter [Paenibacillus dendritiformis]
MTMQADILIEAAGLVKAFGGRTVVNGVDVTIRQGEVTAIIGANEAGKSTTLDLLLGPRRPDQGQISYWTKDPYRHIGLQLQSTPFFPGFNALENLRMFAAFYGCRLPDRILMEHLRRCGLGEAARTDAARLSGGQQKRLAIAMALVHHPALLFLDEPTAALDPRARHDIRELIHSLAEAGTSLIFTSHDMEEVYKLASRIIMMNQGVIQADGTPEDLLAAHQADSLEELYLRMTES